MTKQQISVRDNNDIVARKWNLVFVLVLSLSLPNDADYPSYVVR